MTISKIFKNLNSTNYKQNKSFIEYSNEYYQNGSNQEGNKLSNLFGYGDNGNYVSGGVRSIVPR
ncbi:hypothetical protein DDB_G0270236 [Dictyostelium discoideum AX4]|uniref:Uncharacterized protein n=1 Tax=Dictyostelium discoideum TaxID=44689 RepID=Q55C42_DICDI|nr:hypothetical protein DDB_G0270236 [Dictyostelium discoideum AX4]EAL72468.1 hypothetical protein DDB_G0270236 [Dictyostelium discoideum AX4]|eukprot:XP_646639.1 hypothetical protein DDB_G0270236 [Dictyostelium discoideum AX4]